MLRFDPAHWYNKEVSVGPTCPIGVVTWPRAIDYCQWLNRREGMAESHSPLIPAARSGLPTRRAART